MFRRAYERHFNFGIMLWQNPPRVCDVHCLMESVHLVVDHLPMWIELRSDFSAEYLSQCLESDSD